MPPHEAHSIAKLVIDVPTFESSATTFAIFTVCLASRIINLAVAHASLTAIHEAFTVLWTNLLIESFASHIAVLIWTVTVRVIGAVCVVTAALVAIIVPTALIVVEC